MARMLTAFRTMDMTMLQLLNARERADDDYADLFHRTDPRFKFLGVKRPEGSRTCTIEAIWQPDSDINHGEKRDYDAFDSPAPTDGTKENPVVIGHDTPMETSFSNGTQNGDKLDASTSAPVVGTEHIEAVDDSSKESDGIDTPQSSTSSTGVTAGAPDTIVGLSKDA